MEKEKQIDKEEPQSLLEKQFKKDKNGLIIFFIYGIFFPPFLLAGILIRLTYKRWFEEIKDLRDNQNEKELLDIVKNTTIRNKKYFYALYALSELGNLEIKQIILAEIKYINQSNLNQFFERHKSNFATILSHLDTIEEHHIDKPIKKEKLTKHKSELEIVKVHFIEEKPKEAKCMITKIALDFDKKEVVICPECLNYAEKYSLKNWLRENNFCPICKAKLTIDDFPLIIIKKK